MSRVPGTFKERPPELRRDHSQSAVMAESWLHNAGAIHAERWSLGNCTVMLARDEIKATVYSLPALAEVTMGQVLGPVGPGEWVNVSENCFHLYEIHDAAWTTTGHRAAVTTEKDAPR